MGIAMFTVSNLFAPLQGVISWFMPAAPQLVAAPYRSPLRVRSTNRPEHVGAGRVQPARGLQPAKTCAARPLRVLRVVESNHAPASAGRMVISGRMVDVCAELDRLAALEATRH